MVLQLGWFRLEKVRPTRGNGIGAALSDPLILEEQATTLPTQRYRYLLLTGELPRSACPLSLTAFANRVCRLLRRSRQTIEPVPCVMRPILTQNHRHRGRSSFDICPFNEYPAVGPVLLPCTIPRTMGGSLKLKPTAADSSKDSRVFERAESNRDVLLYRTHSLPCKDYYQL
jgi:hypothetical protein